MSRIGTRGLEFLIALTVGLLVFLLVDSAHDGLEAAALVPGSLQGPALFAFGAAAAYLALEAIGAWLAARRREYRAREAATLDGWVLALLIAIGIGLHNFGEGLAIGSAFALGELALGTLLIVGFTLHNTTEGLAIVAPLARERAHTTRRVSIGQLLRLGLIGGVPTIFGAWIGGFVYSPAVAVLFLALGVGAIAQVTRQILRQSAGQRGLGDYFRDAHIAAGLACGVLVMYVTGLFV
jgi:zinc transporter ZupT